MFQVIGSMSGTLYLLCSLIIIAALLFTFVFFLIKRGGLKRTNLVLTILIALFFAVGIAMWLGVLMSNGSVGTLALRCEGDELQLYSSESNDTKFALPLVGGIVKIWQNPYGSALVVMFIALSLLDAVLLSVRYHRLKKGVSDELTAIGASATKDENEEAVTEEQLEEIVKIESTLVEDLEEVAEQIEEELAGEPLPQVGEEIEESVDEEPVEAAPVIAPAVEEVAAAEDESELVLKYRKGFKAKLIQSDDKTKEYYCKIKSELLSYKGVGVRNSWGVETLHKGRQKLVAFRFRGKKLEVCFAISPETLANTKYKGKDVSAKKSLAAVPFAYNITSDRKSKYSLELVHMVLADKGYKKLAYKYLDPAFELPYEHDLVLLEKGLVKESWTKPAAGGGLSPFAKKAEVNNGANE